MHQGRYKSHPEDSHREEPDVSKCKTSPITATWLNHRPLISHCLVEKENCRYVMSFAYGYLCKHPDHMKFAGSGKGSDDAPPAEEPATSRAR